MSIPQSDRDVFEKTYTAEFPGHGYASGEPYFYVRRGESEGEPGITTPRFLLHQEAQKEEGRVSVAIQATRARAAESGQVSPHWQRLRRKCLLQVGDLSFITRAARVSRFLSSCLSSPIPRYFFFSFVTCL